MDAFSLTRRLIETLELKKFGIYDEGRNRIAEMSMERAMLTADGENLHMVALLTDDPELHTEDDFENMSSAIVGATGDYDYYTVVHVYTGKNDDDETTVSANVCFDGLTWMDVEEDLLYDGDDFSDIKNGNNVWLVVRPLFSISPSDDKESTSMKAPDMSNILSLYSKHATEGAKDGSTAAAEELALSQVKKLFGERWPAYLDEEPFRSFVLMALPALLVAGADAGLAPRPQVTKALAARMTRGQATIVVHSILLPFFQQLDEAIGDRVPALVGKTDSED